MTDIIHFVPRAELDADANLRGFIELCRNQLTIFGADLDFDSNAWDVTGAMAWKATKRHRLIFSAWRPTSDAAPSLLPEPFLSFAKAYMRYEHAFRPTKGTAARLAALRALAAALSENGQPPNPTLVTPHALNRASQLCVGRFTKIGAYGVSRQLESLNEFMIANRLLAVPLRWRAPTRRPSDSIRVGPEFDRRRWERLPSPAALSALAEIFHSATEASDVLVSSIVAILCSAPDRISEVLYLREDCEVTQIIPSTGKQAYGLRWSPAKGAEPMVKWVIPSMVEVVKEAVLNIRRLTEQAREIARWYEKRPSEIYLPPHLEHLRHAERITLNQVEEIVFGKPIHNESGRRWCRSNNIPLEQVKRGECWCRMVDVRLALIGQMPRDFPWAHKASGLKYSEALCVILRHQLNESRGTYRSVIELVSHGRVSNGLGAKCGVGVRSIFERHGFTEDDGTPLKVATHQFRHYLNTMAQAGGLSQLDIAKWSGRKDVRQNRAYDHQSDRDVLTLVRNVFGDQKKAVGPLATVHQSTLIPRDEFARLKVPTAHTTEFGYCIHDFSMLPCQLHRDCLNCTEQVCIKGDTVREADIRRHRAETRQLLEEALSASEDQHAGANRWVAHQQETLARLDELCTIFDDPDIPVGSVIQPTKVAPASRLEQAARDRAVGHSGGRSDARQTLMLATPNAVAYEEVET